jgi:hypothetical protein
MDHQQVNLLDAGRARVRHAQMDVGRGQKFIDAPAALARHRDDVHLARARRFDGGDDVARIAGGGDREQHVAARPSARTCLANTCSNE